MMDEKPKRPRKEWIITASWVVKGKGYPVGFKTFRVRANRPGLALRLAARELRAQIKDGAIPKGKTVKYLMVKLSYVEPVKASAE